MARDIEKGASPATPNPIAGLGEADKRVLSYAATIGMEFDFSVLAAATEMQEEPLAESLERLVHRGILRELRGGDTYAFIRVVTLAQVYRDISSSRLRVIHGKIADAYEKLHPDPTPDIIPEMGRHFHLAQVHDKALVYNRYAAAQAMGAFSPDVAIHYLARVREDLAALPGDHRLEESDVLKELGEQYSAMGDGTKADEYYAQSLGKLPEEEVTLRALLLMSRANAARETDKLGLMRQYIEEAIRLFEKVGHKRGLALAHRTLTRAAYKEGRYEVGKREIELTLGYLDPEKDAKEVARCYIEFGNVLSIMPDPAELARAIEYYRKAIQSLEPLQDYAELGRAHNNIAVALGISHPREALKELEESRICAERTKDKRSLGWTLFNTVEFHLALGEETEAARNNAEARRILSRINDPVAMQHIALNEGILAQHRKAYEESERAYLDSLIQAESLGYPPDVVEVLMYMAMMYAEWGKKDQAIRAISRIKEVGEDQVFSIYRPAYEDLKKQLGI
jgi:tetratricopeptide (TPR) repeat protein